MSTQVEVQRNFKERRALATGLLSTGISIAFFVWPPVFRQLINFYGWRGAFIINSGIMLNAVVCGALLRPNTLQTAMQQTKSKSVGTCGRFHEDFPLCLYITGIGLFMMVRMTIAAYIPLKVKDEGISKQDMASLFIIFGVIGTISRPIVGRIGDMKCVSRVVFAGVAAMGCGVIVIMIALMTDFLSLACFFAFNGIVTGKIYNLLILYFFISCLAGFASDYSVT